MYADTKVARKAEERPAESTPCRMLSPGLQLFWLFGVWFGLSLNDNEYLVSHLFRISLSLSTTMGTKVSER